jgi:hypothetical protein
MNLIDATRENNLEAILTNNAVPSVASILNNERDREKTTERYQETDDLGVITTLNDHGWFIKEYQQVNPHKKYSEKSVFKPYMATYKNANFPKLAGQGELTVLQRGAHDGTKRFVLDLGFFKWACLNGLVVGERLFEPVNIKHIGDIPSQLGTLLDKINDVVPQVYGTIQEMTRIILTDDQKYDFASRAIALRYPDGKTGVNPKDVLQVRRTDDANDSLWSVMNAVEENLIKAGSFHFTTKNNVRRASRAIKNIDLQYKINTGIWEISESYLQ